MAPSMTNSACTILIVDDDEDISGLLEHICAYAGYTAVIAQNGEEALTYLHEYPAPRLIFLDLMMPLMDGFTFYRRQRQEPRFAAIPVIVMSAGRDVQREAQALGLADVLPKLFNVPDVLALLATYCR